MKKIGSTFLTECAAAGVGLEGVSMTRSTGEFHFTNVPQSRQDAVLAVFAVHDPVISDAREKAIIRIKADFKAHIDGGIDVASLHYPTTRDDQADINGLHAGAKELGAAGEPYRFMCRDVQGIWARRDHTAAQITDAALAVFEHVRTTKNRLDEKIAEVEAVAALPAPTQADFDAIVW